MFWSRLARLFAMFAAAFLIASSAAVVTAGPASAATCNPGTFEGDDGVCYFVPKGSYQPNIGYDYAFACPLPYSTASFGATSISQCNVAPSPGSYAKYEDYTFFDPDFPVVVHELCAPGTYQPFSGQQSCFNAPPGTYIDVSGATSSSQAHLCPAGTFSTGGASSCTDAPAGYRPNSFTGATGTIACSPGTTSPGGQAFCDLASPGYQAPFFGMVSPSPCAAGSYNPYYGATSCLLADVNHYVPAGAATSQLPCPAGTYQPTPGSVSCIDDYVFVGFAQPVDGNGQLNSAKAGRTIPLKWRVLDTDQNPITDLTDVTVTAVTLPCANGVTPDAIEEYASGTSVLQNLGEGYFQWNWQTPTSYAKSCKTLTLDLGDGAAHTALFSFTK